MIPLEFVDVGVGERMLAAPSNTERTLTVNSDRNICGVSYVTVGVLSTEKREPSLLDRAQSGYARHTILYNLKRILIRTTRWSRVFEPSNLILS
jgi:hypothetical protein